MSENIFDKRKLKTFSNCIDLVKSMVGTREGLIAYNKKFRIDLENTCYKASMYDELQQRIDKAIEYIEENSPNMSNSELYDLLEILKGGSNE